MARQPITLKEYLEIERRTGQRHELVNGKLIAMAGETREHYRIARVLEDAQANSGCEVVMEGIKVRVRGERYRYPDVTVSCDPGNDPYFIENPCFIAEVLSESIADTDQGKKLEYTKLPSMQTYAIVAQTEPRVIVYQRDPAGWRVEFLDEQGEIRVPCLETSLSLQQIYAGIGFTQEEPKAES